MTKRIPQPQGTMTSAELYRHVLEQGIEHDSHASDLYIKVDSRSQDLVQQYKFRTNVTTFTSQIDKQLWYDIPFAYQPFWEKRSTR